MLKKINTVLTADRNNQKINLFKQRKIFMAKNKKMLIAINFILIGLLSSCAVPYRAPSSGSTATINFLGTSGVVIFQKSYTCKNPALPPSKTFKIPAKKLFTFEVNYAGIEHACSIVTSFTPDLDQKYFVHFSIKNYKCYVSVDEKLDPRFAHYFNSNYLPVHIVKRNYTIGWLGHRYCADKISRLHKT